MMKHRRNEKRTPVLLSTAGYGAASEIGRGQALMSHQK